MTLPPGLLRAVRARQLARDRGYLDAWIKKTWQIVGPSIPGGEEVGPLEWREWMSILSEDLSARNRGELTMALNRLRASGYRLVHGVAPGQVRD